MIRRPARTALVLLTTALAAGLVAAPAVEAAPSAAGKALAPAAGAGTLNDSFSGTSLDKARWMAVNAHGCTDPSNARVSGGLLHLITTTTFCGVRIAMRTPFRYGDVTARIRFDLAQGSHGGLTFYGDGNRGGFADGEMDIAEEIGRQPHTTHVRVWTQARGVKQVKRCGTAGDLPTQVNGQWHTYGVSWHPGSIRFTLDGLTIWQWSAAAAAAKGCTYPFDGANYRGRLYFTTSVGGQYAHQPPANHAGYPLDTEVDSVTIS